MAFRFRRRRERNPVPADRRERTDGNCALPGSGGAKSPGGGRRDRWPCRRGARRGKERRPARCVSRLLLPHTGGLRQPRRRPRLSHCVPVLGCHDVRRRRGWRRVRKRPRPEHGEDCRNDDWVSYRPHVVACRSEELRRTDRTSALTLTTRALVAGEFGITTRPPALTVASSAG